VVARPVISENVAVKSANKDVGQLSRMLKDISTHRRLNIPDIVQRSSAPGRDRTLAHTIRNRVHSGQAAGNRRVGWARYVLYVVTETGMRHSEVVNLQVKAIRIDAKTPNVRIQPDGRKLKTEDSEREIPLV
jgi:integrase